MRVDNQSFTVRMRCTVTKEVIVSGCSEECARIDPFEFAEEETEVEQIDYKVISVRPNN